MNYYSAWSWILTDRSQDKKNKNTILTFFIKREIMTHSIKCRHRSHRNTPRVRWTWVVVALRVIFSWKILLSPCRHCISSLIALETVLYILNSETSRVDSEPFEVQQIRGGCWISRLSLTIKKYIMPHKRTWQQLFLWLFNWLLCHFISHLPQQYWFLV